MCDVCVYFRSAIYGHGFKLWISLYFLSFYILAVIIMCNLLIALIVVRGISISCYLHQRCVACDAGMSSNVNAQQECYEACLSFNLEDFSLSANLEEEEDENVDDDKKLFLEYDRQLMIMARIANFDKASHRLIAFVQVFSWV